MPESRLEAVTVAIHTTINEPTLVRYFGRNALHNHNEARRIVWVRARSPFEKPKQGGGRPDGASGRGQAIEVRVETVQAHCYAVDDYELDQLVDALVAAVALNVPQARFVEIDWTTQQFDEEAGENNWTEKAVVTMQLRLPVLDEVKPLVFITNASHDCGIIQPGDTTVKDEDGNVHPF